MRNVSISKRLFMGAFVCLVLLFAGSLLYLEHSDRQALQDIARTEEAIRQWNERQNQNADETIADTSSDRSVRSSSGRGVTADAASQKMHASRGAGNPHPFEKVPVDLWDFEATKAAMIENINYVKAHWDPKVYNRDVSIADAIASNIANATYLHPDIGLFTPEQAEELRALRHSLLDFQGIESGRVRELKNQGHTNEEALRIATDETLQRWGVSR